MGRTQISRRERSDFSVDSGIAQTSISHRFLIAKWQARCHHARQHGSTPLFSAVCAGSAAVVDLLLANPRVDVNMQYSQDRTVLSQARMEVMIDWVPDDDANNNDGVKRVAALLAHDILIVEPESKSLDDLLLLSIRHQCNLVFNVLPDRWQSRRTFDEAILKNAAARGGPVIIKRLLDLPLAPVITDLVAAAGSKNRSTTVVQLLLDRCDGHPLTESVVQRGRRQPIAWAPYSPLALGQV
ncbi:hypothetical protein BJX66DRAFT_291704 [Aspergillus keveii]|uniref:Uncharacterized protein n=1 Tax=Aspergillus keveii TaxID=714993 RepID=A0ABR4GMK7_9EURO